MQQSVPDYWWLDEGKPRETSSIFFNNFLSFFFWSSKAEPFEMQNWLTEHAKVWSPKQAFHVCKHRTCSNVYIQCWFYTFYTLLNIAMFTFKHAANKKVFCSFYCLVNRKLFNQSSLAILTGFRRLRRAVTCGRLSVCTASLQVVDLIWLATWPVAVISQLTNGISSSR